MQGPHGTLAFNWQKTCWKSCVYTPRGTDLSQLMLIKKGSSCCEDSLETQYSTRMAWVLQVVAVHASVSSVTVSAFALSAEFSMMEGVLR